MKRLITILVIAVTILCNTESIRAQSTFLQRNSTEKFVKAVTTTNATATTIDTIGVATNEAGWLEMKMLGYYEDSTSSFVGTKLIKYYKVGGTLTITSTIDSTASINTPLSGSDYWVTKNSYNNLVTKVSGKASKTVYWKLITKQYLRRTD